MWRSKPAYLGIAALALVALLAGAFVFIHPTRASASSPTYNINTLAGKLASLNGTAGLQIRFSAYLQEEADTSDTFVPGVSSNPINPSFVLSSPLDGTSVGSPGVTANQDAAAASQNETAIAVDPSNPNRVVAAANDYVTRTWTCAVPDGTPCSAHGDGYSGTYYSNDGGQTWCCASALDGSNIGTQIPGVEHLVGGQYDAGGDPALAFDSRGNVYYAGLGFDRTAPPSTVTVNKGTFDAQGKLTWGAPVFINQTTSPSTLNDKEWIAADANSSSPFRDRVYVTFTRFIFNAHNGNFVQAPIMEAYSNDGGKTFSTPQIISGNALYDQGSRPVVGPDGTVYVFFEGATRLSTYDSTDVVKSTDGGVTWSKPVSVSQLGDIVPLKDTGFRVNSFPAAAIGPDGTLYAAWSTQVKDSAAQNTYGNPSSFCGGNVGCHSAAVYSVSHDGGATWSAPAPILAALDAANRTPVGYSGSTNPDNITPDTHRVDSLWPGIAVSGSKVYMSAYAADVVSPWQTCAKPDPNTTVSRINCLQLGKYVNNARLDYVVTDLTSGVTQTVTANPINTRYQFGGGFIGDYTSLAAGSDGSFHAFWTDTNNVQTVVWWYGYEFVPTKVHQQDVVTASGNF
ncbi:MAG TPA: sialidase family protein [Ktedonobacterales bacterium]